MTLTSRPAGRASWFALAAIVMLVAGLVLAWRLSRPPRSVGPPSVAEEPSGQIIARALEQATPEDSTAWKLRWLDEVRGVDLAGLDSTRIEWFLRHANARLCTCGCGYTLATCRASDMTCGVSGEALAALLDSLRTGSLTGARGLRSRPPRGG